MNRRIARWLLVALMPTAAGAQSGMPQTDTSQTGMSQAQMEADCLRRLAPLMPADAEVRQVGFSALGNYATYYVVTYRFKADLRNDTRAATCTYRREGQWVRDDADAYRRTR